MNDTKVTLKIDFIMTLKGSNTHNHGWSPWLWGMKVFWLATFLLFPAKKMTTESMTKRIVRDMK